ncbi:MAG: hypothetical protein EBU32_12095 [Opitutaceae bacterium]|nr:hypothetical protein [Opitutaceae bacterium]
MKALVLTAPSQLEFADFPKPVPADDEVLLRIHACGICGSDIHGWDGSTGRRLSWGTKRRVKLSPSVRAWSAGARAIA